jgi:hypothetical protein
VARSIATYSTTEFLRFDVTTPGSYSLHVVGLDQFSNVAESPVTETTYGLAWNMVAVPEPSLPFLATPGFAAGLVLRLGRRRSGNPTRRS